ncbi:hypothetical protein ACFOOK_00910 [Micromonospora krabiensis]|uniref:hypothetical protein n=1 Tax=Micromonospora krabiensis TaxID=307121 RepID=UPI00155F61C7|nr:hypothetical protein [Micromonospora krabiensis]
MLAEAELLLLYGDQVPARLGLRGRRQVDRGRVPIPQRHVRGLDRDDIVANSSVAPWLIWSNQGNSAWTDASSTSDGVATGSIAGSTDAAPR